MHMPWPDWLRKTWLAFSTRHTPSLIRFQTACSLALKLMHPWRRLLAWRVSMDRCQQLLSSSTLFRCHCHSCRSSWYSWSSIPSLFCSPTLVLLIRDSSCNQRCSSLPLICRFFQPAVLNSCFGLLKRVFFLLHALNRSWCRREWKQFTATSSVSYNARILLKIDTVFRYHIL